MSAAGFWCRWRYLPEEPYRELSEGHPLIQTRFADPVIDGAEAPADPLARLLAVDSSVLHQEFATRLTSAMPDRPAARAAARLLADRPLPASSAPVDLDRARIPEG